jgi:hypothetical protein
LSNFPFKETKTISFGFNEEYFLPEGVIKKPSEPFSLTLTDIFPDLNDDRLVEFSFFVYLMIFLLSLIKFIIIYLFIILLYSKKVLKIKKV